VSIIRLCLFLGIIFLFTYARANYKLHEQICKDKDEAEAWFVGLKALIAHKNYQKMHTDFKGDRSSCDSLSTQTTKDSVLTQPFSDSDRLQKVWM
jgi:hypothetical protein